MEADSGPSPRRLFASGNPTVLGRDGDVDHISMGLGEVAVEHEVGDRVPRPSAGDTGLTGSSWGKQGGRASSVEARDDAPQGLVHHMMPLIWSLRIMLMLPVTILPNGRFRFGWRSVPLAVSAATWAALLVASYLAVRYRQDGGVADGARRTLWDALPRYAAASGLCYIAALPYSSWATAGTVVEMLREYQDLEGVIRALNGKVLPAGLRARAWGFAVLCLGVPAAAQAAVVYLVPGARAWVLPSLVHGVGYLLLATCFWHALCTAVALVATQQADAMDDDYQRLGLAGLRAHRQIWLGLARVVGLLGHAWGRTQSLLLATYFLAFTTITYVLLFTGALDSRYIGLGAVNAIVFAAILTVCNSAQALVDAVRTPATKALLRLSRKAKSTKDSKEIRSFLRDIKLEAPAVSVCGLALLSRGSILSLFALATTYIVVLSQFEVGDGDPDATLVDAYA